jgi:S1-C subfamily serine protease
MIKALLLTLITLFITSDIYAESVYPSTTEEYASTVVMILNKDETGGGTGVIYHSTAKHSFILTNNHICKAVEHGGVVLKGSSKYMVRGYKPSKLHDMCMIYVDANLGIDTEIADKAPEIYTPATIAGFPHLAPETVVHGHFSALHTITIQIGERPCTPEEFEKFGMQCIFGGVPVTEKYQSQFVTATILPGNSGSPVYNSDGEIAGLVFASDSRDLAYAEVVPQEFVKKFITEEAKTLLWLSPVIIKQSTVKPGPKSKAFHIYNQPIYHFGE